MRKFSARVEVLRTDGTHLYYTTATVASALVAAEHAEIGERNGKIKSVRLTVVAANAAERIAEPTPPCAASYSTRFCVRERLDCGAIIWQHHRRATDVLE